VGVRALAEVLPDTHRPDHSHHLPAEAGRQRSPRRSPLGGSPRVGPPAGRIGVNHAAPCPCVSARS
jgi:hypothetical protein